MNYFEKLWILGFTFWISLHIVLIANLLVYLADCNGLRICA